jgi:hypothetical protein
MTFAREPGGDLRAGSTMTTAKGKFVSSRASTRSLPLGRAAERDHENGTILSDLVSVSQIPARGTPSFR